MHWENQFIPVLCLTPGFQFFGVWTNEVKLEWVALGPIYVAPLVKLLYLTDLAQTLLSLCIDSHLCAHLATSAQR